MHKLVRTITAVSFAASCAVFSTNAIAQDSVTGSIGYSHFDFDHGVELGAIIGSLGYEFELADNFSITPEARIGNGVNDDRVFGRSIELGLIYGAATRASYKLPSDVYFFATASYVNYELKGRGISTDSWEFGIGAGMGFYFTENLGLELQYENVDSVGVFSGALRFRF